MGPEHAVFMQNNPAGFDPYVGALGAERVMVGFPSSGGLGKDRAVRPCS